MSTGEGVQREVIAHLVNSGVAGHWRITARPYGGAPEDITWLRGAPVTIGEFSFADPCGPQGMTLTLPQVTIFDRLGAGELDWVVKHTDIDVTWTGAIPAAYPQPWAWEGYIASFAWDSDTGLTVELKGAMMQLDNWLAKPGYPARPLPYEYAIAQQFLNKPSLRLRPLQTQWPSWWAVTYKPPLPGVNQPSYMTPTGVTAGQRWSGLVTRSTGSWEPVLSSYVQSLLGSMHTDRGRWTLDLAPGRQPVLFHRDFATVPGGAVVEVDPASPGVRVSLAQDWEAAMTTVYASGKSLSGVQFTGMRISADGSSTGYTPAAATRQAWPAARSNLWHDPKVMAKEVQIQAQSGMSADDAAIVARGHLNRFADPGVTGTVTLDSDPTIGGQVLPRHLVRAGMSIHISHLLGLPEGILAHVSASSHSISSGTTTLTIDSRYRDQLTVAEVQLRGRDSLSINRMLLGGQYAPVVPDQLYPWSYEAGSGYIPSNALFSSRKLLGSVPEDVTFPWESWTRSHPPKSAQWSNCYSHLGPVWSTADKNWITQSGPAGAGFGIPIKMAQSATIRLLQIAAYDRDGNVLAVPFHVSFYTMASVSPQSMPLIPAASSFNPKPGVYPPYKIGQHYPYVKDGWEKYLEAGTETNPAIPHPTDSVGLIRAYGNYYERAGYFPGNYAAGDPPTGMLVDESTWDFTCDQAAASFDVYTPGANVKNIKAGLMFAMIYCDAQGVGKDVFFAGRLFRQEPGSEGA
jgi:hypothetical protein